MSAYRPRWRADATGYVAGMAGKWAGPPFIDREHLVRVIREMPNGDQIEIEEWDQ